MRRILAILVGMLVLAVFATPITLADTSDVTTRWIVPADTTIVISYPNGQALIEFNTVAKNFTNVGATGQTVSLAALRVKNNGNTAVKIEGNWTTDWPTGVTWVNMSIDDWANTTHRHYSSANETIKQPWVASLTDGLSEDFWFWSTGIDVDETAGVDRTLRITSTNV